MSLFTSVTFNMYWNKQKYLSFYFYLYCHQMQFVSLLLKNNIINWIIIKVILIKFSRVWTYFTLIGNKFSQLILIPLEDCFPCISSVLASICELTSWKNLIPDWIQTYDLQVSRQTLYPHWLLWSLIQVNW